MLSALEATSSVTVQLIVVVLAIAAVVVRSHGRAVWRRQTDRRLHPARAARFAAGAAAVVAGAVLVTGMAATTRPRPPVPKGDLVRALDPMTGRTAATFVLFNPVPGRRERPSPLSYGGASY